MTERTRILAEIRAIPHRRQRYATCGDWAERTAGEGTILDVTVSQMADWRHEALVAVHEFVEALLCRHRGVSEFEVTRFDKAYEAQRKDGDESEPGDDPAAPYRLEHKFASKIERLLADELEVDWNAYEAAIDALG